MLTENQRGFENTSTESCLRGDTASDDVTPVKYGGVLELSALIKVALLASVRSNIAGDSTTADTIPLVAEIITLARDGRIHCVDATV